MATQQDSTETERVLSRIDQGDRSAVEQLLQAHRPYIKRIIELRMEEDLRARVDASDVAQDVSLVVSKRIDDFMTRRPTSFRIWLRRKTLEQIIDVRRHHRAQKRSVGRDCRLSDASSMMIAKQLINGRPSQIASQKEIAALVRAAIEKLGELDRETLLLRHVEGLSNAEVAELLELDPATARKRHGRAIRRLGDALEDVEI